MRRIKGNGCKKGGVDDLKKLRSASGAILSLFLCNGKGLNTRPAPVPGFLH
jgi:hypothetical protein